MYVLVSATCMYLHKQDMGHIEFPNVMFTTELDTLSEDLLHLLVVLLVPVDPGLGHKYRDVTVCVCVCVCVGDQN